MVVICAFLILICTNVYIAIIDYDINHLSINNFQFDQTSGRHAEAKKVSLKLLYRQNVNRESFETIIQERIDSAKRKVIINNYQIKYFRVN